MKQYSSMSFEELLSVKAKVEAAIATRVEQERKRLTASLQRLDEIADGGSEAPRRGRRKAVVKARALAPKYRNPANPEETWAGRGLRPRWLAAALKSGKKLSDFAVDKAAT